MGRHTVSQEDLATRLVGALEGLPDPSQRRRMVGFVYAHSGIRQRHVEGPMDGLDSGDDWLEKVGDATVQLSRRTLADLRRVDPEGFAACDALVVVTTSHMGFPSLSRKLQQQLEIPLHATCWDLGGLGCAGPTHGIHLAWSLVQQGCRNVCLLFVDTMATWALSRRWDAIPEMSEVVAHCLASDGAAAMLIGAAPGSSPLFSFAGCTLTSQLWPDSLDQNDLTSRRGQPYLSVGKDIRTRLLPQTQSLFDDDVLRDPMFLHPGGPDLMKRLAATYPALGPSIEVSSKVLEDHGNLGSSSVLFVLEEALRRSMPLVPRFHLFALGPGIVTTILGVDGVEA